MLLNPMILVRVLFSIIPPREYLDQIKWNKKPTAKLTFGSRRSNADPLTAQRGSQTNAWVEYLSQRYIWVALRLASCLEVWGTRQCSGPVDVPSVRGTGSCVTWYVNETHCGFLFSQIVFGFPGLPTDVYGNRPLILLPDIGCH